MRRPTEVPANLRAAPVGTGRMLLLTPQKITAGIRRDRWRRRKQRASARQAARESTSINGTGKRGWQT